MINFLMIMEKAVCTSGVITLQDQKIKSSDYHFLFVGRLMNILVLFLLQHLNWIERYSTMKIGRFFFVWVYLCMFRCVWSLLLLVQCSPVLPVTFLHSLLWTSWRPCMSCSLDTEKGTSMTLLYHRIALVSVANKTCTTFSYIFDRKC